MKKMASAIDVKTPEGWLEVHRAHGGRPYFEVKIGEYHRWLCTCGERFFFTDKEREHDPNKYVIGDKW